MQVILVISVCGTGTGTGISTCAVLILPSIRCFCRRPVGRSARYGAKRAGLITVMVSAPAGGALTMIDMVAPAIQWCAAVLACRLESIAQPTVCGLVAPPLAIATP